MAENLLATTLQDTMASLMSHPGGGRLPEDGPLERLVARLEAVGSAVGVIRLVERWADHRSPTRGAMLAESRAFVNLRLMDRAWVRLRELSDSDPGDVEVVALTAEMFIARGWPARAARLLDKLQSLGLEPERLRRIEEGASAAPIRPPANAREIERGGSVEQQIRLAETFLATGSMLRARGLLERLGTADGAHSRVQQLLWGLRGEFTSGQQNLSALVTELQAGLSSDGGGWDAAEPTASLDQVDPETAEASKVMPAWQPTAPERGGAFSGLFRMDNAAPIGNADEIEDDVTVAAVMASQEEMAEPPTYEHSDPDGVIEHSYGDTQIMQVIGSGDNARLAPVAGQVHTNTGGKRGPVDLRQWRAEHGVDSPASLMDASPVSGGAAGSDVDFLEEEDEDLVVMTRQEEPVLDPRTPMVRRSPISVIEKVPVPPAPVPDLPGQDEPTPTVQDLPLGLEPTETRSPSGASAGESSSPLRTAGSEGDQEELEPPVPVDAPSSRSSFATLLIVSAGLVAVLLLLVGVVGLRFVAGSAQSAEVRQAVLNGSPEELLHLRTELRASLDDDGLFEPAGAQVAARLVLVDLALWEIVSGDPMVLTEARQLASEGLAGPEAALAVAWLDHVSGASASLRNPGKDPLTALLLVEQAMSQHDWDRARMVLDGVPPDSGVRLSLAALQVQKQSGPVSPEAVPAEVSGHPLGRLWLYSGGDASLSEADRLGYLTALRKTLPDGASKLLAQTHLAEAALHEASGRREAASGARAEALKANPNDPTVLALVAAEKRSAGQALKLLRHCMRLLATSPGCQRGILQVHLEDRNETRAEALVKSWMDAGVGVGQLGTWVALQQGNLSARPEPPDPTDPHRSGAALVRYLDALAQKSRGARQSGLTRAVDELKSSSSFWDRRLATYVEAEKERLMDIPER